jgi:hypothetical protein
VSEWRKTTEEPSEEAQQRNVQQNKRSERADQHKSTIAQPRTKEA